MPYIRWGVVAEMRLSARRASRAAMRPAPESSQVGIRYAALISLVDLSASKSSEARTLHQEHPRLSLA